MLVLKRRVGEAVIVGDDVRILVLEVRGDGVRLGVEAPSETIVDREEVSVRRKGEEDAGQSQIAKVA